MTVDAGAFVEPSFILCGIGPYHDYIILTIINEIRDIITYADIAAFVIAQEKTIHPDMRIPEDTVKLQLKPAARIGGGDGEMFAVPADAGFRKQTAHGFVPMRHHVKIILVHKGEFHRPVVGKIQFSPLAVIEFRIDRRLYGRAGFGKTIGNAVIEIFFRDGGMTEMKLPVTV